MEPQKQTLTYFKKLLIMSEPKFYQIRQNPYENTVQLQMKEYIENTGIVTCPFGHIGEGRNKVMDAIYDDKAGGQDKRFIHELRVGDYIMVIFTLEKVPKYEKEILRNVIFGRIVSEPLYGVDTGHFTFTDDKGKINISNHPITSSTINSTPFRPVGRRIEIIDNDFKLEGDRRSHTTLKSFDLMFEKTLEIICSNFHLQKPTKEKKCKRSKKSIVVEKKI